MRSPQLLKSVAGAAFGRNPKDWRSRWTSLVSVAGSTTTRFQLDTIAADGSALDLPDALRRPYGAMRTIYTPPEVYARPARRKLPPMKRSGGQLSDTEPRRRSGRETSPSNPNGHPVSSTKAADGSTKRRRSAGHADSTSPAALGRASRQILVGSPRELFREALDLTGRLLEKGLRVLWVSRQACLALLRQPHYLLQPFPGSDDEHHWLRAASAASSALRVVWALRPRRLAEAYHTESHSWQVCPSKWRSEKMARRHAASEILRGWTNAGVQVAEKLLELFKENMTCPFLLEFYMTLRLPPLQPEVELYSYALRLEDQSFAPLLIISAEDWGKKRTHFLEDVPVLLGSKIHQKSMELDVQFAKKLRLSPGEIPRENLVFQSLRPRAVHLCGLGFSQEIF
eukprot:g13663.t1